MSTNYLILIVFVINSMISLAAFSAEATKGRSVIIFVLDGVRKDALLHQVENGDAPTIGNIIKNGTFRSGHIGAANHMGENSYPSISGFGWRTITGFTQDHGVLENTFKGSRADRPNFLALAKQQDNTFTGLAAVNWPPVIDNIFKPFDKNNDFTLESFGHLRPEKDLAGDRAVKKFVIDQFESSKELPRITFVGYDGTDFLGHHTGYSIRSKDYLEGISTLSELSGEIIRTAERLYPDSDNLYIFTTDHGGRLKDKTHIDPSTEFTRRTWTAAYAPHHSIDNLDKVLNGEDVSALAFKFLGLEFPEYYQGKISKVVFNGRSPRRCADFLFLLVKALSVQ